MYGYDPLGSETAWGKSDYGAEFAAAEVRRGFIRKVFGKQNLWDFVVRGFLLKFKTTLTPHCRYLC